MFRIQGEVLTMQAWLRHEWKRARLPLICGIKTVYWREFLKTFQENTSDVQARAALERLRQRVQKTDIPSSKSRSALAIIAELEVLLDLDEPDG